VSSFVKNNFFDVNGVRLPYFVLLPANYDPERKYPLYCSLHGSPGDETIEPGAYPGTRLFASLGRQQTDPAILLTPTRRVGDEQWTDSYIQLVSQLMDVVVSEFSVDTNRIHIEAFSEGVHAAWDVIGRKPGFFAGARLADGYVGSSPATALASLPLWISHSAADPEVNVSYSRTMVRSLRVAGGKPIYTEYAMGDHIPSIETAYQTPAAVNWLAAQRNNGPSAQGPLLSITNQFPGITPTTAATTTSLTGVADALGQSISNIIWENVTLAVSNNATGSNVWSAASIPLLPRQANLLLVTGTTVSWAPALGGNTTFNDSINLLSSPIQANLSLQSGTLNLDWTGGVAPYQVQMSTNLSSGVWTLIDAGVTPPVSLSPDHQAAFYRIVGQ